jgi:multiple sugar transport system substrate-binding protein
MWLPKSFLLLSSLLLWGVSGPLLSGCSPSPRPAGGPVTIVFEHAKHPHSEYLSDLIRAFEREHPQIRVREEILPSDSDQQHQFYVINLAAGSAEIDVLDLDIIWVQEFARAGWLEPLERYLKEQELADLNPFALAADRRDHRLFALPWFVDAGVLYYRKDLLQKYRLSPPRTYEELVAMARAILDAEQDPQLTGFLWQGMQYEGLMCVALEMIRGNGAAVLTPGGFDLTGPATLRALDFLRDLTAKHGVTPASVSTLNEESTRHIFQSGRAIFMRNWPYAWTLVNLPGSPVAGRVGITMVPHFSGNQSVPTLGGYHLGVNSRSLHKREAAEFVRFMTRYPAQKDILMHLGVLPADMRVYRDPESLRRFPFLQQVAPALRQARARPLTPYYPMISQILQPELSAVVTGIRPPRRAMERAEAAIARLPEQP